VTAASRTCDVLVVGGGPAGATMGWALARRGVGVVVLERTRFPREKVCGDFVEPRGLKLLEAMGCLPALERSPRLPITHVAMFLASACAYRGRIPFYGGSLDLPAHGYIVPRDELDTELLSAAKRAGAIVFEDTAATAIERQRGRIAVAARQGGRSVTFKSRLVVGADGAHSIVARHAGLLREDPRYVAVSQRAYLDGVSVDTGEAAFFFDRDLFPGYGWMFPMPDGRANAGVGVLAETRSRWGLAVPQIFQAFLDKLRAAHPGCAKARLASKPLGGIVRTYGCAGPNHFDAGVLVGDAGCFVDPMTGEGITPAMESALLAAPVVAGAVGGGRAEAASLAAYETAFRRHFDPSMRYLDFCAAVMRNRWLADYWIAAVARGCRHAREDGEFARVAGAGFGGLDVQPLDILTRIWIKAFEDAGAWWGDLGAFTSGWWQSLADDPAWHLGWASDVSQKWMTVAAALGRDDDPRRHGPATLTADACYERAQ
jgi:geranylgeranyl reductase family protein